MEHQIETPRLILKPYTQPIADKIFNSYDDEQIKAYFGISSNEELELEKAKYKQGMTMFGQTFYLFYLIIKETGEVAGWCGYHRWYLNHRRGELGYVLNAEKFKRKGYMSEALPAVIQHGFETMNLHRIEALISPENIASLKLIKTNGFEEEGVLKEHYFKSNVMEDSVIYGLLRHQYLAGRSRHQHL